MGSACVYKVLTCMTSLNGCEVVTERDGESMRSNSCKARAWPRDLAHNTIATHTSDNAFHAFTNFDCFKINNLPLTLRVRYFNITTMKMKP